MMAPVSRRRALSLLGGSALALGPVRALARGATRTVTDSAGRKVAVPTKIKRIFAAGTPAAITLYTLVPDRLAGWPDPLRKDQLAFLPPKYAALPVTGRLTGRANTANVEAVLAARPDLVVDIGTIAPIYATLADRVQRQTGVPYVLMDGSLTRTPTLYRELGAILGVEADAKLLADQAQHMLDAISAKVATIPKAKRIRVYYARGPEGLETGVRGSINTQMLDFVGAINVAKAETHRNIATVSPEQVLLWNPDAIIAIDPGFYHSVWHHSFWQDVPAVKAKRVYLAPDRPFSWFDSPPASNRLLGLAWLGNKLYPKLFPADLSAETRQFYRRFYHIDLTAAQLTSLLEPKREA